MPLASPSHILAQNFDTNDLAFKKIDEKIAALQENIRSLNAFRNTFTPSYHLPPEILTYIFSLFEKDPILPLRRRIRRGGISIQFTWLVATRVSQHWRNVALGSPGLWAYISNSYPKRVIEELLQRSKAAPLSVHLNHGRLQSVFFIGTSLPRIYNLKLIVDADTWNTFWSNLSSPAPLLESLSVSISDTSQPLPTISNSTFAGTTPSLRRLDLTGCSVDVTSSLFKELTTLRLNCPFEKISATDILTVLRGLPQLTSLALSHVFPENPTTLIPSNFNTVALPKLKSLSINGETYSQDLDFLSYLAVPAYSIQFCSTTESLTDDELVNV
ncbi:hypothetical protein BDN72DRAFT_842448 [Pluteus cervinus]|uniref:Uncharacterized protein n=1 Tax=Pluteus cervinus TaxID=181527 RepID=A0ACD3ASS1_9AGAR|nr:hypothetical protein BDN72DRAFT_842448 [Pluteus cervinus]